jgi:hypothetical protein
MVQVKTFYGGLVGPRGPKGDKGDPGVSIDFFSEVHVVDEPSKKVYELQHPTDFPLSLWVIMNGVVLTEGEDFDYVFGNGSVTFSEELVFEAEDLLVFRYVK